MVTTGQLPVVLVLLPSVWSRGNGRIRHGDGARCRCLAPRRRMDQPRDHRRRRRHVAATVRWRALG